MVTNIKKFCAKHHENILGFSNIYPKWAAKYLNMDLESKGNMPHDFCDCKSNDKNIYAKFHEKIFNDSQDKRKIPKNAFKVKNKPKTYRSNQFVHLCEDKPKMLQTST